MSERRLLGRIRREPWVIMALRERKPILPRPFREDILERAEKVARNLRDPDFFAEVASSTILGMAISTALVALFPALKE